MYLNNHRSGGSRSTKDPRKGCIGLANLGNTCYANSALQCLSHAKAFQKWMRKCGPAAMGNPPDARASCSRRLVWELFVLFERQWGSAFDGRPCEAIDFVRQLAGYNAMYLGQQQHDTQEFLRMLLDCVHEELKRKIPKYFAAHDYEDHRSLAIYPPCRLSALDYEENYEQDVANSPTRRRAIPLHFPAVGESEEKEALYHDSSIVSEVFGGTICSTITCTECRNKSHKIDPVFDVSVPIPAEPVPSDEMQMGTAQQGGSSSSTRGSTGSRPGSSQAQMNTNRVASFFGNLGRNVQNLFYERGIGLDDCIRKFCEPEQLTGSEKYDCEKCKRKTNGEKILYIRQLPEVLCIHLKRFRYDQGWFGNKNTKPVSFPIDCLDMKPYLDPHAPQSHASSPIARGNGVVAPPSTAAVSTRSASSEQTGSSSSSQQTKYRLIGLIQHSGNMGGGHYIAYCRHAKRPNEWFEYDDSRVTSATEEQIKHAEPYVLFYEKIPLDHQNEERKRVKTSYKDLQRRILEMMRLSLRSCEQRNDPKGPKPLDLGEIYQNPPPDLGAVAFISRRWYVRCRTMAEPGPLDNHLLLSPHGYVGCTRLSVVCEKFLPICAEVFEALQRQYGGGPALRKIGICKKSLDYIDAYNFRRAQELKLVQKYDTKDTGDGQFWYLVDASWVANWKRYVKSEPCADIGDMVHPLKVTNYRLFELPSKANDFSVRPRRNLRVKVDFMGVNARVWALFHHFHGVLNPKVGDESAVCRVGLEVDSLPGEEEVDLRPEEIDAEESLASQRLSWQYVDVFHGDWNAYQKSRFFREPQPLESELDLGEGEGGQEPTSNQQSFVNKVVASRAEVPLQAAQNEQKNAIPPVDVVARQGQHTVDKENYSLDAPPIAADTRRVVERDAEAHEMLSQATTNGIHKSAGAAARMNFYPEAAADAGPQAQPATMRGNSKEEVGRPAQGVQNGHSRSVDEEKKYACRDKTDGDYCAKEDEGDLRNVENANMMNELPSKNDFEFRCGSISANDVDMLEERSASKGSSQMSDGKMEGATP